MTQQQKILTIMCRQPSKWFYPYEFMRPDLGDLYVGYKAPTRISELHAKYPYLFQTKKEDKYMQRRLNLKEFDKWYERLDEDLKEVVDRELDIRHFKAQQEQPKAVGWM